MDGGESAARYGVAYRFSNSQLDGPRIRKNPGSVRESSLASHRRSLPPMAAAPSLTASNPRRRRSLDSIRYSVQFQPLAESRSSAGRSSFFFFLKSLSSDTRRPIFAC